MEKFNVEMRFFVMKKDYGEMDAAQGRQGLYRIDIRTNQSKMGQIKTAYHEFTHVISDMFFGARYITKDEETLCGEIEKAIEDVFKKHTRNTIVVKIKRQKKRKRRQKNGKNRNDKN